VLVFLLIMDFKNLIKGLKEGDKSAYKFLFTEHYIDLCNYIYNLSKNRVLAEDLVQEVFIKLWEKRTTLNIKTSIKSYLYKASHNQFLQHIRKEKNRFDVIERSKLDLLSLVYIEDESTTNLYAEKLDTLINDLPPKCKTVFLKSKIENKKYKEIAQEMNISVKTVENHIGKALRILRESSLTIIIFTLSKWLS